MPKVHHFDDALFCIGMELPSANSSPQDIPSCENCNLSTPSTIFVRYF
ncbi:MAG: hypothetical protein ABIL69_10515 [candidate division WOR-3 bacterium]